MARAVAMLLLLAAACGPEEPDHEIVGRCEPLTDSVRMVSFDDGGGKYVLSVGQLDGWTLLILGAPLSSSATSDSVVSIQWFGRELSALAPPDEIGTTRPTHATKLVAFEGALHAQMEIDSTGAIPATAPEDAFAVWRFVPPPEETTSSTSVPLALSRRRACAGCPLTSLSISAPFLSSGPQGRLPATVLPTGPLFAHTGIPSLCYEFVANAQRLWVIDRLESRAVLWGDDPCQTLPGDLEASNPEVIALNGARVGVLFRLGDSGTPEGRGDVHFLELGADGTALLPPRRVGGEWIHFQLDSGYQPKAAAVGTDRVVWVERADYDLNSCQQVRLMNDDGTGAQPAPWQLPCYREPERWYTSSSEVLELPDGRAALVWGERSAFGRTLAFVTELTSETEWEEGIFVTMLTADGRRGSEVLEVTDAPATAIDAVPRTTETGPFPRDFLLHAAADGDEVVVVWTDTRADAPGIYGRRLRCGGL